MEDYKILIYLVLSILYFLFRNRGKKKEQKPVTQNPQTNDAPQRKTPKSFEELLRELSGENQQQTAFDETPSEFEQEVDERLLNQEIKEKELINYDDSLKELYKKGDKLKSIDELVDYSAINDSSSRFEDLDEEAEENSFAKEIRDGLSNPDSAKKAIVYAEIFNRKY